LAFCSYAPGVVIPLRPFFGVMGVAPKRGEKRPAAIPEYFGGNMDNKELVVGTTLYLPVQAEALLQFFVRKDLKIERPIAETPTHWITMGFHKDLDEAAKTALRDAVRFLSWNKGLTPDDALAIASLAVDFRITQIVDGNKGIHAMIPKGIFRN
jgi:acetamidase/formamidase